MTYVTEQTSAELRAHMRRLKAMAGWHEPLADRLFKEIVAQDEAIYGCDEWSTPTVNLATAHKVITAALAKVQS